MGIVGRTLGAGSTLAILSGCLLLTHVDEDAFRGSVGFPVGSEGDASPDAFATPDASTTVNAGPNGCPSGRGPRMVRNAGFCIDATEVSIGDYIAFLDAKVATSNQPRGCEMNTDFTPHNWNYQPARPTFPVGYVSWCDAHAYCAWAGKRLCGQVGGGLLAHDAVGLASSEWFTTCSKSNTQRYPYGNEYRAGACTASTDPMAKLDFQAVGTVASCEVDGVSDLSGNVWEWIDACSTDGTGNCVSMGGSIFTRDVAGLSCAGTLDQLRTTKDDGDVGFRCCR